MPDFGSTSQVFCIMSGQLFWVAVSNFMSCFTYVYSLFICFNLVVWTTSVAFTEAAITESSSSLLKWLTGLGHSAHFFPFLEWKYKKFWLHYEAIFCDNKNELLEVKICREFLRSAIIGYQSFQVLFRYNDPTKVPSFFPAASEGFPDCGVCSSISVTRTLSNQGTNNWENINNSELRNNFRTQKLQKWIFQKVDMIHE